MCVEGALNGGMEGGFAQGVSGSPEGFVVDCRLLDVFDDLGIVWLQIDGWEDSEHWV